MVLLVCLAWSFAQGASADKEDPEELVKLRDSYEKKAASVISPLRETLLKRIGDLETKLITKGRVDDAVQVREFRLGIQLEDGETSADAGAPKELVELVKKFSGQREKALAPVQKIYVDALRKLEVRLVKAGRVTDAVVVQRVREAQTHDKFRLVIWNTHNGSARDRGSLKANVVVSEGGRELWKKSGIPLAHDKSENKQTVVQFTAKSLSGCRLRIEITEWYDRGGGLSEIELFRKGEAENLAKKAEATSSANWGSQYPAEAVIDGVISPHRQGMWLLKDRSAGWIELKFPVLK